METTNFSQFTELEILNCYYRSKGRHLDVGKELIAHFQSREDIPAPEKSIDSQHSKIENYE